MAGKEVHKVPGRTHRPAAHQGHQRDSKPGSQTVGKRSAVPAAVNKKPAQPHPYEAFLAEDPSGKTILESAIRDMTLAVWALYSNMPEAVKREPAALKFPVVVGNSTEVDGSIDDYPPPSLHRWTKDIGNHEIWLRGTVEVIAPGAGGQDHANKTPRFHVAMTMTIKPLGHARFKRYEVKKTFDFTPEEIELMPFNQPNAMEA